VSEVGELTQHWVDLRSASRSHLGVRLVSLLGALLLTGSLAAAGAGNPLSLAATVLLGGLVVLLPTTLMPSVLVLWGVAVWWAGVDSTWHWALLPAAAGLLLVHVGAALASATPPQAPVPTSVLRLWAGRTALVAAATAVVWGFTGALAGRSGDGGGAVPGIVGLAVLTAALLAYLRLRAPAR
jgi:hypothetical protein